MRIECILRRPGGTTIDIADKRIHFKPKDGSDDAPHVADVDDETVAKRLLSIPEGYRLAADDTSGFRTDEVVTETPGMVSFTVNLPASIGHLRAALDALGATNVEDAIAAGWPDHFAPPATNALTQPLLNDTPNAEVLGATPPPVVIAASAPETAGDTGIGPSDGDKADQSGDAGPSGLEVRLAAMSDAEIRAEFERVVGRRPSHRAQHETMATQIIDVLEGR